MPEAALVQSPLQPPSPTPPGPRQPGGEEEEKSSVCHEALGDPQAHVDCYTHSLIHHVFVLSASETDLRLPHVSGDRDGGSV